MFTFRLEPLITIRDNVLKECQGELAKAYQARMILAEALQDVEKQIEDGIITARSLMQTGQIVKVDYLIGLRRQEMFLRANQNDLIQKIQIVDEEIERRRTAVTSANKELKIVENLKEKRFTKYLEEENKSDAKMMDEIASKRKVLTD